MVAKLLLCGVAAAAAFQAPMMAPTQHQAARTATPQMGATIRELRDRVGSVKNTKKITSAMKLVAAAKVRRAQEAVLRSRPFSETLERILGGLLQRLKTESLDIPLLETRTAKKVGLVVITGDRGLCGGYNAQAIKKAELRIAELKSQDIEVELITVGNKGITYFKKPARQEIAKVRTSAQKAPPRQGPTAAGTVPHGGRWDGRSVRPRGGLTRSDVARHGLRARSRAAHVPATRHTRPPVVLGCTGGARGGQTAGGNPGCAHA